MWDREKDPTLELDGSTDGSSPSADPSDRGLLPGDRVGSYRIVRQIGRGGMAEVYRAARADEQFEQTVALKVLQPGRVSRLTVQRFEQERQIVASLSHPNIASLLDGGVTEDGRPYFVMELVEGQPLDEYCDRHRLSVKQRLELFVTVGRAVHYAHQNLWVHRDLKPANILVTDDGQVKLLDFGIAKLLEDESQSDSAVRTRVETAHHTSFWMTPQYASPEQLKGLPITTAADQYQLGLILFELLTGRLPYDLATASLVEVIRIVCELESMPPSSVVTKPTHELKPSPSSTRSSLRAHGRPQELSLTQAQAPTLTIAAHRTLSPSDDIGPGDRPPGDKLPDDRSPGGRSSNDVSSEEEGLEQESSKPSGQPTAQSEAPPVDFLPTAEDLAWFRGTTPSRLRRRLTGDLDAISLRCLQKKPRSRYGSVEQMLDDIQHYLDGRPVAARSGLAYRSRRFLWRRRWAVGVGVVFLSGMIGYAVTVTQQNRRIAEERDRARVAAAEAEQVKGFLVNLFEIADPTKNLGEELTVRQLLDQGAAEIESQLKDQPAVRAEMLFVMGRVFSRLGDYGKARSMLSESLELRRGLYGDEHLVVAQTLNDLAMLHNSIGSYERAETVHREVLEIRQKLLGRVHPKVAGTLHNLASALELQGAFEEAEQRLREALAMDRQVHGTDIHRDVSYDLNSLGELLLTLGRLDEAQDLLGRALEVRKTLYGDYHPTVARSQLHLARLEREHGRLAEAAMLAERSFSTHRQIYGDNHHETARSLYELGWIALETGNLSSAADNLEAANRMFDQSLGSSHPSALLGRAALGRVKTLAGQPALGLDEYASILKQVRSQLAKRHPDTADIYFGYGQCLATLGRLDEAQIALADAFDIRQDIFGSAHPKTQQIQQALRELLQQTQEHHERLPSP